MGIHILHREFFDPIKSFSRASPHDLMFDSRIIPVEEIGSQSLLGVQGWREGHFTNQKY